MNKAEALELLKTAPQSETVMSIVNPSLTQKQHVKIIIDGVEYLKDDKLNNLFEKRVWQAVRCQERPKF